MKTLLAPRSLQARLLTMVTGLVALVWVCAAVLTWFDARKELDELLDGHLAQAAALLAVQADGDDDDIAEAPVMHKYAPQVAFQVFVNDQLITRSSNVGTTPLSSNSEGFSTIRMADGASWRVFSNPVPARQAHVYVAERLDSRQAILWAIMRSMLWPLVIALPLLSVAVFFAVRKGLSPVRRFSKTLRHRSPQAIEPLEFAYLPPELRPIADALNALFERIALMVESERRFTADAAHELRTPIAAIRAQAQVALGAGDDTAGRNHALQITLAGCDRATRLVEQLLMLARLEAQSAHAVSPVNLCAIVRHVAADLAPKALARSQSLEVEADSVCTVAADETLLGVLVRNLVDNALRYSPAGARVLVTLQLDAGGAVLCVQDSGPGLSSIEMQRLGERFFRVLGTDQPGSGLGWSIVRRIADVTGGQVQIARSAALGGLSVTVVWPT